MSHFSFLINFIVISAEIDCYCPYINNVNLDILKLRGCLKAISLCFSPYIYIYIHRCVYEIIYKYIHEIVI